MGIAKHDFKFDNDDFLICIESGASFVAVFLNMVQKGGGVTMVQVEVWPGWFWKAPAAWVQSCLNAIKIEYFAKKESGRGSKYDQAEKPPRLGSNQVCADFAVAA